MRRGVSGSAVVHNNDHMAGNPRNFKHSRIDFHKIPL